ncbi:MAG: sigma-54 dependent transcriptional regulator [Thiohalospira sp.]
MSAPILVVDDEPDIRELIQEILADEGYAVVTAANGAEARERRRKQPPSLTLLDIWMPDVDGITLLREWQAEEDEAEPVIMISGHATVESAVEATRLGAWDFLEKPLSLAKLLLTVRHALEAMRLRHENRRLRHQPSNEPVGRSAVISRLREAARQAAERPTPVFLHGEPGTGKRSLARYIHGLGPRADAPLVEVSAATLAGEEAAAIFGAESEHGIRHGLLDSASGGTLFLSHVSHLDQEAQMLLLAALETGSFRRRGGERQQPLDVRLIAADIEPLEPLVTAGTFRRELYDRLAVLSITVPPLRERLEDLPDLLNCYADHFATEEGLPFRPIGVAAQNRLRQHTWPGNLRELRNVLQRLSLGASDEEVGPEEVVAALPRNAPAEDVPATAPGGAIAFERPLREAREAFEHAYFAHHLHQHDGRIGEVARVAGVERTHLYRKLRTLGLHPRQEGGGDGT